MIVSDIKISYVYAMKLAIQIFCSLLLIGWVSPAKAEVLPLKSPQRMQACLQLYEPQSHDFAVCWNGYATKPAPVSEFCTDAGAFLNNDFASDWQKAAVYEKMRNAGCMN